MPMDKITETLLFIFVCQSRINAVLISELGDKHSQEHPGLLSFSVLFFRWHNFLADKFMAEGSEGVDFTFARTRHWVIASLQVHITAFRSLPNFYRLETNV